MPRQTNTRVDATAPPLKDHLRHLVRQADAACARLGEAGDGEAVHDFRVALRRLRTLMRLFGSEIGGDDRLLRKLRRLARRSNHARDLEIELDWLQTQRKNMAAQDREFVRRQLRQRKRAYGVALGELRHHVMRKWPGYARALRRALRAMPADLTAAVTARIARGCMDELNAALRQVRAINDVAAIHRSRICAKRVRYLLEAFRAQRPELEDPVARLTALQDVSGAFHDRAVIIDAIVCAAQQQTADVLRRSARPTPAALALLQTEMARSLELLHRARQEQQRLFADFRSAFLGGRSSGLRAELAHCARLLAQSKRA